MPRRPRIVVEGAVYHIYNRIARGEPVFSQEREADQFVELLRTVARRDDVTIFAWCLMANHYHLAVRVGAVPLARTMAYLQARVSTRHNRRRRSSGPLWQSRYKAKIVTDQTYLMQLIAYIHLNPVTAGIVTDPAAYERSGHRELIGRTSGSLVGVPAVLALFDSTVATARRKYRGLLRALTKETWTAGEPGRLPWWGRETDSIIEAEPAAPLLDPLGRSGGLERERLEPREFVARACEGMSVASERVLGGALDRALVRQRQVLAALAIERWRIRAGALARVFGRRPEVVTRWAKRAGELRVEDADFREAYEHLDAWLAKSRKGQSGHSVNSGGPGT
jgi:REP element-mobilizing transposase RayT